MSVLTIYTNSFPYGNAETFLESEIPILSLHFEKIYIIPFQSAGEIRSVPGNVIILSPVQNNKWPSLMMYFAGFFYCSLIFKIPELKKELKTTKKLLMSGFGVGMTWATAIMNFEDICSLFLLAKFQRLFISFIKEGRKD